MRQVTREQQGTGRLLPLAHLPTHAVLETWLAATSLGSTWRAYRGEGQWGVEHEAT